jgi:acetyltransferase-like isoleucine patch superfamily enzyme
MKEIDYRLHQKMGTGGGSAFRRYGELIVGRPGLGALIKYELIMFFSCIPGAAGLFLRSRLFPLLLKKCGRNVIFGTNVVLRHPSKIEIGDNVIIDDNCLLDAKGAENAGIRIGNDVFIGRNTILSCKNGDILLEDEVNLGFNCYVFSGSRVKLDRHTLVAAYCYFIGGGHDYSDTDRPVTHQSSTSRGIRIGENCWFGAGARILDGVRVGSHAVIGAQAVVNRDLEEYAVAAGVPARVLKSRRPEAPSGPSENPPGQNFKDKKDDS